jgi:hypothetical protein
MHSPLYTPNPTPPPDYLQVTRPWNRWQLRIPADLSTGFPECILATGSIDHSDWTPRQDGTYWANVWNQGSCVLTKPYPYFAAHGIQPPYPTSVLVRIEFY